MSKRLSVLSSIVIAIFDAVILITSSMIINHTIIVCKLNLYDHYLDSVEMLMPINAVYRQAAGSKIFHALAWP